VGYFKKGKEEDATTNLLGAERTFQTLHPMGTLSSNLGKEVGCDQETQKPTTALKNANSLTEGTAERIRVKFTSPAAVTA